MDEKPPVITPRGNAVDTGIGAGAFEFTPEGLARLGQQPTPFVPPEQQVPPVPRATPVPQKEPVPGLPAPNTSPRGVVRQATARAKELRKLIRQATAWQKELDELERLIAAAKGRHLAPIKNIESSRKTG